MADGSRGGADDEAIGQGIGDWLTEQVFGLELESVTAGDLAAELPAEPRTFADLRPPYRGLPPWMIRISPAGHGSRPDVSALAVIGERADALALRVTGLDQAGLEHLVSRYGRQFLAIEFQHCPLITDLTPLEDLAERADCPSSWRLSSANSSLGDLLKPVAGALPRSSPRLRQPQGMPGFLRRRRSGRSEQ